MVAPRANGALESIRRLKRSGVAGLATVVCCTPWTGAHLATDASTAGSGVAPHPPTVVLTAPTGLSFAHARVIPHGFLGLSFEYSAIEPYAGRDPSAIDPVFEQLIENISPGQDPVLRIGGDSTDWSWWPVPHMRRPAGVRYTITPRWVQVTRALSKALHAHLILGINLEADNVSLAAAEAHALVRGVGAQSIEALELGNEPELYHSYAWYRASDGLAVPGRPAGYDFAVFDQEFSSVARVLPGALAGPATGGPRWLSDWRAFFAAEPRVRVATLHRYALPTCGYPTSPGYPTTANLLSDTASVLPATSAVPYVQIAHADHIPLRVDEMNTTPCPSVPASVGHSFASALWALDVLFEMAAVGVDGVNIHSYPGAAYDLFTFTQMKGTWRASVEPEYYGLLLFAQASPAGSRLLGLTSNGDAAIRAWATEAPNGVIRVVLINDGDREQLVSLRARTASAPAMVERLQAPGIDAQRGVTLGGQSFGSQTGTGRLVGRPNHLGRDSRCRLIPDQPRRGQRGDADDRSVSCDIALTAMRATITQVQPQEVADVRDGFGGTSGRRSDPCSPVSGELSGGGAHRAAQADHRDQVAGARDGQRRLAGRPARDDAGARALLGDRLRLGQV